MVTHEEHRALADRVEAVEQKVEQHDNEHVASKCSLLRAYVMSHADESLKAGMLGLLTDLERRVRPLSLALERANRIERDHAELLDHVAPRG
jgi:hypothetical protein